MGRIAKEVVGQVITFIGLIMAAVTCGIPMWRVTYYIGANITTAQIVWDGLWMNCVMQATGQMQCRMNTSIMSLSTDLQTARALIIFAIIFGFIGFLLTFIGAKCTSCLKSDSSKPKVVILAGCLIIFSAILVLIPVCWSAAVTITDFLNPLTVQTQQREIGSAIYTGWGASALLLIGGIVLTTSCPPQKPMYPGNPPAYMYPYSGPVPGTYGPVYAPATAYSGTGTYAPNKPYAAPAYHGQYL